MLACTRFIVDFSILHSEIEKIPMFKLLIGLQGTPWLGYPLCYAHHSSNCHKYRMLHPDTVVRTATPDQV